MKGRGSNNGWRKREPHPLQLDQTPLMQPLMTHQSPDQRLTSCNKTVSGSGVNETCSDNR